MKGLASKGRGPVDQLEDRYLGMVEAVGSNPTRSTFLANPLLRIAWSGRSRNVQVWTSMMRSTSGMWSECRGA